jgi:hypothetical protein
VTKVLKSAYFGAVCAVAALSTPGAWAAELVKLTGQSNSFTLAATTVISYGANNVFHQKTLQAGTYVCGDSLFGDPVPFVVKACYRSSEVATTPTNQLTYLVGQHTSFKLTASTIISYGANNVFNQKTLQAGTYTCGDALFGDPIPFVLKSCFRPTTVAAPTQPTYLVGQSGSFKLTTATVISYGANGVFTQKTLQPGTYACTDQMFGDPLPGVVKSCYTSAATPPPVAPLPDPGDPVLPGKPIPLPGDVMVNGSVSNAEYQAMARKMGTEEAIAYRYGPSSAEYGTATQSGLPTYGKRASQSLGMVSRQNPNGRGDRGCGWQGYCGTWQVGGPVEYEGGDYSSSILNFGYIPDAAPDASFFQKSYAPGVGSVQTLAVAHNTTSVEPEPSWTTYGGVSDDGGAIDPNIGKYKQMFTVEKPVALGKCYGRNTWCTNTLAVFADGRIVGVGSNTAHNMVNTKLAAGKVPTGITITNSGEFALVTVWDTAAMRGQVAVIALGDACQGCLRSDEGRWESNWGNWKRSYPGLPGLGNYNYAKVIGYVDLPDTLKAPTEISASTGLSHWDYQTVRSFWSTDLDDSNVRNRYNSGDLSNAYARTGMAVVVSKSEKRAAFIDLRPLFAYYKQQYFAQSQSGFNAMIANRGEGASQWPYTFDSAPAQKPTVVKVVDLANRPTAVKVSLEAPHRAFIATQEGKLRVFDLGGGYLNQNSGGSSSDIAEKFSVDVGRNPTAISYIKEHGWGHDTAVHDIYPNEPKRELIVTSRGDRKLQWVRFDTGFNNASVARTLQESRVIDPISTEDTDNHGTESYIVSIADYAGKSIHNFLYGPIVWHTYASSKACSEAKGGCKMLDNAPFEYGGAYKVPGKPFHAMGANIN